MNIGIRLYTILHGQRVGADPFGNVYYQTRHAKSGKPPRRWVIYKGEEEASKIPADWHAWIHCVTDTPPSARSNDPLAKQKQSWLKPHLPNLTGTDNAYRPRGHVLKGAHRQKATGDYEPWEPKV